MQLQLSDTVREKLIRISTRKRPLHKHSEIVSPQGIQAIPESVLFDDDKSRRILELGAGWGEFCVAWKERFPEDNYVAFEIKGDRIKKLLKGIEQKDLKHIRIVPVNFNWFLEEILPPSAFDLIIINFPDPWPKKRHWKHRLVQEGFPERMAGLLRPGGEIHLATDYGPYARKMLGVMRKSPLFSPVYAWPHYLREKPPELPGTRFEQMHLEAGKLPYYQKWKVRNER